MDRPDAGCGAGTADFFASVTAAVSVGKGVLLFAACDGAYYEQFGRAFVRSAVAYGNRVHIHLINPSGDERRVLGEGVTYSEESGAPTDPAWYAGCRFLRAPLVWRSQPQTHDRLLILDVDSIVRGRLEPPHAPVGLFLRDVSARAERSRQHSRVAAGQVLMGPGGAPFFDALADRLKRAQREWYADQIALAETLDDFEDVLPIHDFGQDPHAMDWTFDPASPLWTAKGPRKFEHPAYLAELARWSDPVS